jgi:hypothetical protein
MFDDGENFVILYGYIVDPVLRYVGDDNSPMLKSKIAIPIKDRPNTYQYLKISAWGFDAEILGTLDKSKKVRILGHIEERSFDSNCKFCNGYSKKFWTEVVVDTFTIG